MSRREQQIISDKDGKPLEKTRATPTQDDWVFIREMDPNRPDVAQKASEQALYSSDNGDHKIFVCYICSKNRTTQGKLNKHLKTHTKPFPCETCEKRFAMRSDLARHIKSQHRTGNEIYRCHIKGCMFTSNRKDNLSRHQRKSHQVPDLVWPDPTLADSVDYNLPRHFASAGHSPLSLSGPSRLSEQRGSSGDECESGSGTSNLDEHPNHHDARRYQALPAQVEGMYQTPDGRSVEPVLINEYESRELPPTVEATKKASASVPAGEQIQWQKRNREVLHTLGEDAEILGDIEGAQRAAINSNSKVEMPTKIRLGRREAVQAIRRWVYDHEARPYPTPTEKAELAASIGFSVQEVNIIMRNVRAREKHHLEQALSKVAVPATDDNTGVLGITHFAGHRSSWSDSGSPDPVVDRQEAVYQNPMLSEVLTVAKETSGVYNPRIEPVEIDTGLHGEEGIKEANTGPPILPVDAPSSLHDCFMTTTAHTDGGTEDGIGCEYNDNPSGPSSYAASLASVFSVVSLASSASDISRGSGYSAVQIATATKVLLSIFYEDETLVSLYQSAIENQNIGSERLQRNLRRLFRAYAGLLEGEATERLEYLASRLVLVKSAILAQSIVEKLQSSRAGVPLPRRERNEESSDEEDNCTDVRPVNEDAFEDLAIFREFLVESEAFRTFRVHLQAFIMPKSTRLTHLESESSGDVAKPAKIEPTPTEEVVGPKKTLTWQKWRGDYKQSADGFFGGAHWKTMASSIFFLMTDASMLATDDVMVAAGLLEPPLKADMVRLRWQCVCGESLHSDVAELRRGGIDELVDHMRRTSGAKVCASAHNHQSGNQQYIAPHPIQWIRKAVISIFEGSTKKSVPCLPQHNTPCTATSTTNNPPPQQSILHLLACMHRNRLRKVLQQERIEDATTDRALLCFLRKQYLRHRGRFLHMLSLKSVKGISFVKLRLPIGGSVDVRHHDPCCVANSTGQVTCECIPPPPKVEPSPGAEYRCIPGPPATYPPIPPVYLASLFNCPTDVHEKDTWILDQLPKRTCGELRGQIGQPAEGWGIYYDEGLDRDMLALTVLLVFLIASLLFGVLWSRFQYDVQGAFGVSAYMVACCAVLLPVIVTRLENKG